MLERAMYRCENPLCRRATNWLELDHVVPRSQGGPDAYENLCALCATCHALKGQGVLLVLAHGDGTFAFHDTRRAIFCGACFTRIAAGELVALPTPAGGVRWETMKTVERP